MIELKYPWALALLAVPVLIALLALLARRRRRVSGALAVFSVSAFKTGRPSLRTRLLWVPRLLRILALVALVLAIARPRTGERFEDVVTHGVDLMVSLDVSGSMRAEDLKPNNRLFVAKEVVREFVDSRKGDRLGLVIFAGRAYTRCPLTLDYGLLKQVLAGIGFDAVEEDGTAIGMGIATATNRLRKSSAKSKVVVLVTDGINNRGAIDPMTAAALAKAVGVKVYTVGVGTRGRAPIPIQTEHGTEYVYEQVPLDEEGLRRLAETTGGYYFRATDAASFEEALKRIGELETTRIETHEYVVYDELLLPFIAFAAGCLLLEGVLATTWLRRLP